VACYPTSACLGDNICATGYASTSWPYRCAQCAEGYYASYGSCFACPAAPALTVVFFILVGVAAIAVGYVLNSRGVSIAYLTIGLDFFQVVALFASARIDWPSEMTSLFQVRPVPRRGATTLIN
jgi:hypothetical protein